MGEERLAAPRRVVERAAAENEADLALAVGRVADRVDVLRLGIGEDGRRQRVVRDGGGEPVEHESPVEQPQALGRDRVGLVREETGAVVGQELPRAERRVEVVLLLDQAEVGR